MAALYLTPLDRAMEPLIARGLFFVRFTDDLVILAPNRNQLRRAIRLLNQHFKALQLAQHPAKTFIGKLSRGFYALGLASWWTTAWWDRPGWPLSDSPRRCSSVTRNMREEQPSEPP